MTKPNPICKGLTFFPIPELQPPQVGFGADESFYFKKQDLPYVPLKFEIMAQRLFFEGGHLPPFVESVDRAKAAAAVKAWLRSWEPSHESKIATVAYALWVWATLGGDK